MFPEPTIAAVTRCCMVAKDVIARRGREECHPIWRDRRVVGPAPLGHDCAVGLTSASRLAAAAVLATAYETAVPCAPLRHSHPGGDLDDAYAIQQLSLLATTVGGGRVVGRKIGLTSEAVRSRFGVDRPDFGVLRSEMAYGDRESVPAGTLLQPQAEIEVAFVLARDLDRPGVSAAEVVAATDFVVPALELVDSRIAGWDITIFDTVADNASSGAFVLGNRPRSLRDLDDLGSLEARVVHDGVVRSSGRGADCMGHPVNAVVWLAREMVQRGQPLRAGEIVLSGALGPLVALPAGGELHGEVAGLGDVRVNVGRPACAP